jgi:hypothetical protein
LKGDGAGGYQQDPQQGPEYPGHGPAPSQNQDSGDDSGGGDDGNGKGKGKGNDNGNGSGNDKGDDNRKDTDILADYLDQNKGDIYKMKMMKDTGIKFSTNKSYLNTRKDYIEGPSLIARYINTKYP